MKASRLPPGRIDVIIAPTTGCRRDYPVSYDPHPGLAVQRHHPAGIPEYFEFVGRIADEATDGDTVRLAPVLIQPIAAAVGRVAVGEPLNGMVEVAGSEQFRFDELIRRGPQRPSRSAPGHRRPWGPLLRRRTARTHPRPRRACAPR